MREKTINQLVVKQNLLKVSSFKYDFFLDNYFKRSSQILIIGCGAGVQSELYPNAINLDIDIDSIKFCKTKGINNGIVGEASHLPFKSNIFNEILLADVIEHFPNYEFLNNVIKELFRVLKKDGRIATILPLKDNILMIRKLYNKIMKLSIPKMAQKEHTLALSKKKLLYAFKNFNIIVDDTQKGVLFGRAFPLIGGEQAFIIFEKI